MLIRKLACQHCLENDFCADEEQERHGLNQNPVYISVHDFEASRA